MENKLNFRFRKSIDICILCMYVCVCVCVARFIDIDVHQIEYVIEIQLPLNLLTDRKKIVHAYN